MSNHPKKSDAPVRPETDMQRMMREEMERRAREGPITEEMRAEIDGYKRIGVAKDSRGPIVPAKVKEIRNAVAQAQSGEFRLRPVAEPEQVTPAKPAPVEPHWERADWQRYADAMLPPPPPDLHLAGAVVATAAAHMATPREVIRGMHSPTLRAGIAGAVVSAALRATVSYQYGDRGAGLAQQTLQGLANGAVAGAGDQFRNITQAPTKVDAVLNGLDTLTSGAVIAGLGLAPFTGGASLIIVGVAGVANLGVGAIHDVTYWRRLSKEGGLITGVANIASLFTDSQASPEAQHSMRGVVPPQKNWKDREYHLNGIADEKTAREAVNIMKAAKIQVDENKDGLITQGEFLRSMAAYNKTHPEKRGR